MKFFADESIDFPVIHLLRQQGLDVRSVAGRISFQRGFVLDAANKDGRLLITSDKDFGELVFRLRKISQGVVLLRIEELHPIKKAELVLR